MNTTWLRYVNWVDKYQGAIMPIRRHDSDHLRSDQIVVPARTSFSGSAIRIWKWIDERQWAMRGPRLLIECLAVLVAVLVIPIVWVGVATWYVLWIFTYGPLFFASRGLRRYWVYKSIGDAHRRERGAA